MAEPPFLEAPRSRWRVVERDRRLVVVDAGGSAPERRDARYRSPGRRDIPPPLHYAARIACRGASDADGRPILTTGSAYDRQGPRAILLRDDGITRLGRVVIAGVGVAAAMAVAGWWAPPVAFAAIVLVAGAFNTVLRPYATRWLDGLGETVRPDAAAGD